MLVKVIEKNSNIVAILVETDMVTQQPTPGMTQSEVEAVARALDLAVKALKTDHQLAQAEIEIHPRQTGGQLIFSARLYLFPEVVMKDWGQIRLPSGQRTDLLAFEQKLFDELLARARFSGAPSPQLVQWEISKMRNEMIGTFVSAGHGSAPAADAVAHRLETDRVLMEKQAIRRICISAVLRSIAAEMNISFEVPSGPSIEATGPTLFQSHWDNVLGIRKVLGAIINRISGEARS
jgi:FKBP-type peptidyl-prolyl cis-trans isomerase (trigger factor)